MHVALLVTALSTFISSTTHACSMATISNASQPLIQSHFIIMPDTISSPSLFATELGLFWSFRLIVHTLMSTILMFGLFAIDDIS